MVSKVDLKRDTEKSETMLGEYRVLDLTDEKGLMCGQLLGRFGADVIKIEKPGGDPARNIGPFFHDIPDPEKSLFWLAYNTNKKGITLNIETKDGQEILKKLVRSAAAVIESFPPGYMDNLGLGYSALEKINPGVVMTSITPFGQKGPYRDYKASDLVCWAMGGSLFACGSIGGPPYSVSHIPQAFLDGAAAAAAGTALALYWRRLTGEGQHVDVSIQESVEENTPHSQVMSRLEERPYYSVGSHYEVRPNLPGRTPGMWAVKDGYINCTLFTGEFGANLNPPVVNWMKSEGMADEYLTGIDWNKFQWETTSTKDLKHLTELYARFFKTKTMADVAEGAKKWRAMITPVSTIKEVRHHPQLEARGTWQEVEHPELGTKITYPCRYASLSETTCKIQRAPLIGEHNLEVYHKEMGFSYEELVDLKQGGII